MSGWKICSVALLCLFTVACAAPRYSGEAINRGDDVGIAEVVIIDDAATREGFRRTIEKWLENNGYSFSVAPEGSPKDPEKLTIEYVGYWVWDLALFLNEAQIEAFHEGQRVGMVSYKAPNGLNGNKFGKGEERIEYMMEVLFGKISAEQATNAINKE